MIDLTKVAISTERPEIVIEETCWEIEPIIFELIKAMAEEMMELAEDRDLLLAQVMKENNRLQ